MRVLFLGSSNDVGARRFLGVGRHSVLEIEDQGIRRQGLRFFKRARVGTRHIEYAAARSNGLRHL